MPLSWYFRISLGVIRSSRLRLSSFSACWRQASRKGQLGQCLFRTTGGASPAGSSAQARRASTIRLHLLVLAGQFHLAGVAAQPDQRARGRLPALHFAEDETLVGQAEGVRPRGPAGADHLHRLVAVPSRAARARPPSSRKSQRAWRPPVASSASASRLPARRQVGRATEGDDLSDLRQAGRGGLGGWPPPALG